MLDVGCKEIVDIWCAMPRTAHPLMPCKSDLNFRNLVKLAPRIYITERLDDGSVLIRLAGTELDAFFKQQLKGKMLTGLAEDNEENVRSFNDQFYEKPQLAILHEKIEDIHGKRSDQITTHLPLCDRDGNFRFKIAYLDFDRKVSVLNDHNFDARNILGKLEESFFMDVENLLARA